MPSFRGRTALVTGASAGIGEEIARALAAEGAQVLLPVRDRGRGEAAAARIRAALPDARVKVLDLDLARLDSVRALSAALVDAGDPLDLLVLNAGIVPLGEGPRRMTVDGVELVFQTNFLGHAALVLGILPLLRGGRTRLVVQSSLAAARERWRDRMWDEAFGRPDARARYRPLRAYRSSKLALGLFAVDLARRSAARDDGLTIQFCHPGIAPGSSIAPRLRSALPPGLVRWASAHLGNPPAVAAQTAIAALRTETPSPRLFAPSGPFGLAGPPCERGLFPHLRDAEAAEAVSARTRHVLGLDPTP